MSNNDIILSQIRQRLEILYQMVDELEAGGGGGGGGGTTNYNDLTNKPSINGQVLTGNKSLSDLGAATSSDITQAFSPSTITLAEGGTFPSSQRTLLTEHKPLNVNDDQYYFLEETGVDYLYGSMPTSGAYPSLSYLRIMKSSFTVEFHNTEIDTIPTDNSDNLITSGGVKTALDGKVDKETGKGLSTNDFTTAEKDKLSGIEQGATRTIVDSTLSSTSTNPVQNKAVQAPIARLVDAGAKNLLNVADTTLQVSGYLLSNQTLTIPKNTYYLTLNSSNSVQILVVLKKSGQEVARNTSSYMSGDITVSVTPTTDADSISVWVNLGSGVSNAKLTNIMLCTAEDYAISPEFVPYAPSNRELYEMILALQV